MATFFMDEGYITYFCALEYCPENIPGPPEVERVIFLVIRHEDGVLNIFFNANWEAIVEPKHRQYIRALLEDFQLRAESARDALLDQIASLSVGPLITHAAGTGSDLKANQRLLDVCRHFVLVQ